MKKIFIILFSTVLFFSCALQDGIDGTDGINGNDGTGSATYIYDSNDVLLGEMVTFSIWSTTIKTNTGYYIGLEWNGLSDWDLNFTETAGNGTPMYMTSSSIYFKNIFSCNGELYLFKNVTSGVAEPDDTLSALSYWDFEDGSMVNYSNETFPESYQKAYPLKIATATEVGLPDTISFPIRID